MADEKQNEELQIPVEWDYEKFKNSAEFRGIKRNKKGQFVPNNEQLRLLVKHEEIKLSEIDTSEVTDMKDLFNCRGFSVERFGSKEGVKRQDFSGIGEWDTSKVETFERMFYFATKFNENISGWDTSSAKSFRSMFRCVFWFNQPIGKWNTSNVTDMSGMFWEAWRFNQPLNEWDTSSVTNMKGMFYQTKFNQDINDWNVSKVTDFSNMFSGGVISEDYGVFNKPLDKWDVSSAENMSGMFKNAINFEQDLSTWGDKLGKLQDMREMFSGVGKYDSAPKPVFSSVVKNPFYGIGEKALKKINILETWYVRDFCKVIDAECKMDDKELKDKIEFLKQRKDSPVFRRYEKFTNPQYIAQMRMLEKALKTPKTRVGKFDSSVGISILNDKDKEWENVEKKAEKNAVENAKFLEDRKWIPENIKEQFKVFLLTEDDKNAAINTWDIAYCEVFGLRFKIKRYKNNEKKRGEKNEESRESISGDFHLIQGYKIEDFRDFGVIKQSEFEEIDEDTSLCFTPRDIYIWHKSKDENDKQGQNNRVFDIVLNVIIAQAYYRKMIGFRDRARKSDENTRKETKELQECHRDVCKFDLKAYNSLPMETNVNDYKFLRAIWKKISDTYSVDETYKELKESIAQMSQLLTDYKRDRQSWWFSVAAVLIALVSLLVAVVSALPVVEKLLK